MIAHFIANSSLFNVAGARWKVADYSEDACRKTNRYPSSEMLAFVRCTATALLNLRNFRD